MRTALELADDPGLQLPERHEKRAKKLASTARAVENVYCVERLQQDEKDLLIAAERLITKLSRAHDGAASILYSRAYDARTREWRQAESGDVDKIDALWVRFKAPNGDGQWSYPTGSMGQSNLRNALSQCEVADKEQSVVNIDNFSQQTRAARPDAA